ncbi:hypothetical protein HanRHA438_Chr16g0768511 [Helianthus annuus]|nr:hypothetical protein HanRHA438_Chr16g0768511 [Helianthus annuus]
MPRPTSQWVCIAILALIAATLTMAHVVKPARSRKLQMDTNTEPETINGIATQPHHSQMDDIEASAIGCGGSRADNGVYGGGQGSGGTSIRFRTIFPVPGLPFGIFVPQVDAWGEGGGYGGADDKPGTGTNCQCTNNCCPMHYVLTPVYFKPKVPTSLNNMIQDGPGDVALGPSHY